MEDIVTRLRVSWPMTHYPDKPPAIQIEAANEIERLRRLLDHPSIVPTGINWRNPDNNETQR